MESIEIYVHVLSCQTGQCWSVKQPQSVSIVQEMKWRFLGAVADLLICWKMGAIVGSPNMSVKGF